MSRPKIDWPGVCVQVCTRAYTTYVLRLFLHAVCGANRLASCVFVCVHACVYSVTMNNEHDYSVHNLRASLHFF